MKYFKSIRAEIENFISKPLPLWENKLTHQLVKARSTGFSGEHGMDRQSYTTAGALDHSEVLPNKQFLASYGNHIIFLEKPNKTLSNFYDEHGLEPLNDRALIKSKAASKLKSALHTLNLIPECAACIAELVNCIQVVASEGPEYDTSYTHPNVPFTIFVSVCKDDSLNAQLRVAESILHEAMHLKLTLMQGYIELVKPNSKETFFSPWRNVQRPLMGVLHGLFVFRAILEFYKCLRDQDNQLYDEFNLSLRIFEISNEIQELTKLSQCKDLTSAGQKLAIRLTQPLNL